MVREVDREWASRQPFPHDEQLGSQRAPFANKPQMDYCYSEGPRLREMSMLLELLGTGIFRLCHGSQLVYNACWEDPRLDRIALRIGPADTCTQ